MGLDVEFCIDRVTPQGAKGWAWLPSEPDVPLCIELAASDGTVLAKAIACEFREELLVTERRNGWCAFSIRLPRSEPLHFSHIRARLGNRLCPLDATTIGAARLASIEPEYLDATDRTKSEDEAAMVTAGFCDGVRDDMVRGWARGADGIVFVELCIDGMVVASARADRYRPDLKAAGIGHGCHGWEIPFPRIPPMQTVAVIVRERGGLPLDGGSFLFCLDPSRQSSRPRDVPAFVRNAFDGPDDLANPGSSDGTPHRANFLVYASGQTHPQTEHAQSMAKAFLPVLESLGRVHIAEDSAGWRLDAIVDEAARRVEPCFLLSFAPVDQTPLGLRCPVIPCVAQDFPQTRHGGAGRRPHDWKYVFRQTGRAIALSQATADAIGASLGSQFPVVIAPPPVLDPTASGRQKGVGSRGRRESIADLILFDTADDAWRPSRDAAIGRSADGRGDASADWGTVFTIAEIDADPSGVLVEVVDAFIAAHSGNRGATLVLQMIGNNAEKNWWRVHGLLVDKSGFLCRILAIHGDMDDWLTSELVRVTDWIVDISQAETQLMRFMADARPAITIASPVTADYINPSTALIISDPAPLSVSSFVCSGERQAAPYSVYQHSLRDVFDRAYQETVRHPDAYERRSKAAANAVRNYCGEDAIRTRLSAFFGLG